MSSKRRSKGSLQSPMSTKSGNTSLSSRSPGVKTPNLPKRSTPTQFDEQLISILNRCGREWVLWQQMLSNARVHFEACLVHLLRRMRSEVTKDDFSIVFKGTDSMTNLLDCDMKLSIHLNYLISRKLQVSEQLERLDALIKLQQLSNIEWKTNLKHVKLEVIRGIVHDFESALCKETSLRRELVQCLLAKENSPALFDYLRTVWETIIFVDTQPLEDITQAVNEELGEEDSEVSFSESFTI